MKAVGHAPDRPTPRFLNNVGGEDYIDLGDGDAPREDTDGEARGQTANWRLAVLREMEAAREGLERMMEA